jgi:hypothetical protein
MLAVIIPQELPEEAKCFLCGEGHHAQVLSLTSWDVKIVQVGEVTPELEITHKYGDGNFFHLYCYLRYSSGGSPIRRGFVSGQIALVYHDKTIVSSMVENDLRPIDTWTDRPIPAGTELTTIKRNTHFDELIYVGLSSVRSCTECNEKYHERNLFTFEYENADYEIQVIHNLCQSCYPRLTRDLGLVSCTRCDKMVDPLALDYSDDNVNVCSTCSDYFYECEECGAYTCDEWEHSHEVIRDSSFRPRLEFFPDSKQPYYFGFELELETDENDYASNYAEMVIKRLNKSNVKSTAPFYIKSDGSLDCGFELVSHPATIEWFRESGLLDMIDRFPSDFDFRAWDTTTCGFHVHVSRTAFHRENGGRTIYSKAHELRFIALFYRNQRFIEALAGRHSNTYAQFETEEFSNRAKHLRGKVDRKEIDRYQVINTRNSNTLEIRIFRGTLRKDRILSNLELVQAGIEYTRNLETAGLENIKNLSHTKFVAYIQENAEKYPELLEKVKRVMANSTRISDSE